MITLTIEGEHVLDIKARLSDLLGMSPRSTTSELEDIAGEQANLQPGEPAPAAEEPKKRGRKPKAEAPKQEVLPPENTGDGAAPTFLDKTATEANAGQPAGEITTEAIRERLKLVAEKVSPDAVYEIVKSFKDSGGKTAEKVSMIRQEDRPACMAKIDTVLAGAQ